MPPPSAADAAEADAAEADTAKADAVVHERAAAKLNLDLLVTGRRPDGYHELDSLVVFTDLADGLMFRPAAELSLDLAGPFAAGLPPPVDNIVIRAARRLAAAASVPAEARITLHKRLPVAAGIGGGSADAAAALRGLRRLWRLELDDDALRAIGLGLGADVPVCLGTRPARLRGIGERLDPLPSLPALALVLVNPRRPLATAEVFRSLWLESFSTRARGLPACPRLPQLVASLASSRSDLEAAAQGMLPAIGEMLALLRAEPGCRLARMSGSGPTCFGLFDDPTAAADAAFRLGTARPGWWVAACTGTAEA